MPQSLTRSRSFRNLKNRNSVEAKLPNKASKSTRDVGDKECQVIVKKMEKELANQYLFQMGYEVNGKDTGPKKLLKRGLLSNEITSPLPGKRTSRSIVEPSPTQNLVSKERNIGKHQQKNVSSSKILDKCKTPFSTMASKEKENVLPNTKTKGCNAENLNVDQVSISCRNCKRTFLMKNILQHIVKSKCRSTYSTEHVVNLQMTSKELYLANKKRKRAENQVKKKFDKLSKQYESGKLQQKNVSSSKILGKCKTPISTMASKAKENVLPNTMKSLKGRTQSSQKIRILESLGLDLEKIDIGVGSKKKQNEVRAKAQRPVATPNGASRLSKNEQLRKRQILGILDSTTSHK